MMPPTSPNEAGGGASKPRGEDSRGGGKAIVAPAALPPDDDAPGLPGFRRWSSVYLLVFVVFVFVVIGLTVFSSFFA
jgi:hypothetical protein